MSQFLDVTNLYYFFSTVSQTYVALIAVVGVIVVFRMQGLDNQIHRLLSVPIAKRDERHLTVQEAIYEGVRNNSALMKKVVYEPTTDFYQIRDIFNDTKDEVYFKEKYIALMYLSGLIDINFCNYKWLCIKSFTLIILSVIGLGITVPLSGLYWIKMIYVISVLLLCGTTLYCAYKNIKTLFIAGNVDREIVIKQREETIRKTLL